ncbi:MAG: sterol desaturase family protein [Flammeovirgaceae bacterium]
MEAYAQALMYAIPIFIFFICIEAIVDQVKKKGRLNAFDTISSLSSGLTNIVKDSLGLVIVIVSYPFLLEYLAIIEIQETWLVYVVAFVALDFAGYWNHRLAHSINYFWNRHLVHHSSEEFNLPCALRQSISELFGIYTLFLIPAAIFGIPEKVIAIIAPIQLFLQFWYHTQYIPKLGFLEYIIITPSQHRVHHAINPIYLDKNLGQIFCIWDRLFGTFQEELEEVPPVYGITRPVHTWNPIKINFQHLFLLISDAWRAKNWADKLKIWFMPVGWRPTDVAEKYPIHKPEDIYQIKKYNTNPSKFLIVWSWFQLIFVLFLLLFMLHQFGAIGFPNLFIYGGMLMAGIYGFTALMDKDKMGLWIETARSLVGIGIILITGDWFGFGNLFPGAEYFILIYFIASFLGAVYAYREAHAQLATATQHPIINN